MYYLVAADARGEHPLFADQDRTVLDTLVQQVQAEHKEFQLRVTDQWPESNKSPVENRQPR
jgi:hypothetical protein